MITISQKNDLINRQSAIESLVTPRIYDVYDSYWDGRNTQYKEDIDAIKSLPSAQPEPHWIPCSEPPKESGTYIVTAYDGTSKRVTFVKYQKTLKRWDLTGARSYWHILAYKPLPEPWRGEEDE